MPGNVNKRVAAAVSVSVNATTVSITAVTNHCKSNYHLKTVLKYVSDVLGRRIRRQLFKMRPRIV